MATNDRLWLTTLEINGFELATLGNIWELMTNKRLYSRDIRGSKTLGTTTDCSDKETLIEISSQTIKSKKQSALIFLVNSQQNHIAWFWSTYRSQG